MDKHSIQSLKKKVQEIDVSIEESSNPDMVSVLLETKNIFVTAIKEWEDFNVKQVGYSQEQLMEVIKKLIENEELVIEIDEDIESWGDVKANVTLKLFDKEIAKKSQTVYQINDQEY
ncbi:hypothetical protein ACFQZE_06965 [Paenibacillus sp. GCM10027627]|uniref:hypothetical protein n=1 Tax=unclassified Paenibacillus TaxID=185978 RepID=UPI0036339CF3